MSADFYIKRNDTGEALQCTLVDGLGTAPNLTGASVRFLMRREGKSTAKVSAAAEVVSADGGVVRYVWQAGDTDAAGDYEGEFEVTFIDGKVMTFPSSRYIQISILSDVG